MRISLLATLTFAAQLKALTSNSTPGYAEVAAGPIPGSQHPFHETDSHQTTCEDTRNVKLNFEGAPDILDCITLRDQIARNPGRWYIDFGLMARIAKYHTCVITLVAHMGGFHFGSDDAIKALDTAIEHQGHGVWLNRKCANGRMRVHTWVYNK